MSVIGIDFGNESCYVAAAKAGGIETLANDYSLRATPSCIAFHGKKRILGVAAKNQQVTNIKNTISGFKRLLGRKYEDPHVQNEMRTLPYHIEQRPDGGIGIRVQYLDEEHVFSPEQITAMLFTKLKESSSNALQAQVNDCVITVPAYYTNAERKALLDAASIAGLNVLRLINETTSTALSYGFYKQDLPNPEEKSRNVMFVDCGHASLQVSICAFNKGKLKMLACACEQVGGRDIDLILAEYFCKDFQTKYKIDPRKNPRAFLRLMSEAEKLKKQMSANSTMLPLNIECFMNDIDVSSSIQRTDMEIMCKDIFAKIENTMKRCWLESQLYKADLHSVEIVGGSSRIPAIKTLIKQLFGKTASTTLNQDEAVSRGAALQCAIMSPAVRVRDFAVTDLQLYPIKVIWDGEDGQTGEMEVFPAFHAAPFSKVLTIFRREPFNIEIYYCGELPYPDPFVGRWHIKDVKPNGNGESQEVKIKVRVNNHGVLLISSATMVEKKEVENENPNNDTAEAQTEPMETGPEEHNGDPNKKQDKKKKSVTKTIELPLESKTHGYSVTEVNNYIEQECKMINNDRHEKERVDARNALEEFVYDMRDKLSEDSQLSSYVTDPERVKICDELRNIENWLYEEGEDCDRQIYRNKLLSLEQRTDPIKHRSYEYENNPKALEELGHAVQLARKAVDEYRAGEPKYDHLTETEILNITEGADKAQIWLEESRGKLNSTPKTMDPPVKLNDIQHAYNTLTTYVNSVLKRPKPKPPTPPQSQQSTEQSSQQNNEQNSNSDNPEPTKTNCDQNIPKTQTQGNEMEGEFNFSSW
jgi:heat shock protein